MALLPCLGISLEYLALALFHALILVIVLGRYSRLQTPRYQLYLYIITGGTVQYSRHDSTYRRRRRRHCR
jgi:hypothetical protein